MVLIETASNYINLQNVVLDTCIDIIFIEIFSTRVNALVM